MATSPTRPRVLVVDDDPVLLRALIRLLARHGADAVPATGVAGAIALLRDEPPPDLIITELALLGARGEDLLRHVRRDRALAGIPVVAMSACPEGEGFDLLLEKPFGGRALARALRLAGTAGGHGRAPRPLRRLLLPLDARSGPAQRLCAALLRSMVRAVLDRAVAAAPP